METKQDYSCGVIPFIKREGAWQVFLIYQYGSNGDVFWTFPKGHPEAGESPEVAAARELFEETGLLLETLQTENVFKQSYSFVYHDTYIEKVVEYFLGFAAAPEFKIQEAEVKEAGWFTLEAASSRLTHDIAKSMLEEARAHLPE